MIEAKEIPRDAFQIDGKSVCRRMIRMIIVHAVRPKWLIVEKIKIVSKKLPFRSACDGNQQRSKWGLAQIQNEDSAFAILEVSKVISTDGS